mmetsp:Transcript_19439/g.49407  ORF Transcript_19439/g.49407 Transcript_19439/m.49407 type:complete len:476 (+) Transcript_19439:2131-3558(+)
MEGFVEPSSPHSNSFLVSLEIADPADAASDLRATGAFAHPHTMDLVATEPKGGGEVRKNGTRGADEAREIAYAVRKVTNTGLSDIWSMTNTNSNSGSGGMQRSAQSAHVLAVDDSPYNIDVAKNMLQMLQHRVTSAENGRVAVDRLLELREADERAVDLILMDCDMPVMDGWDATAEIRRIEQARGWNRVPIIAITAYASSDSQARCIDAGMDDYLAKPYSLATLRQKVAIHLKEDGASMPAPAERLVRPHALPDALPYFGQTSASSSHRKLDAGIEVTGLLSPYEDELGLKSRKPSSQGEAAALRVAARPLTRPHSASPRSRSASQVLDPLLDVAIEHAYGPIASKPVVNNELLVSIFGGNTELISQAVAMFISSSTDIPQQIKSALATHNYGKLHRVVHQCKGSAGYIGAERVATISLTLQLGARELQQQQAAAIAAEDESGSIVAPLHVRAQVHVLIRCLAELFAELDSVKR